MATHEHKAQAPKTVTCAVITVSDTRTEETDKSGKLIKTLLDEKEHHVGHYAITKDDYVHIQHLIKDLADRDDIHAILLNGGTGISRRDTTYEAVKDLLDKEMPGFGEIFRLLSFQNDIGAAAILSRAVAGVYKNTAIFSMPGSSGAVKLAMNELILPELSHVRFEIEKQL
ncbi:MogA/MoaB family molybdenum cofactor biosynthesis protein [Salinibacillus xinjiangensis]|uniref:Molybdenum cofactor biosynthesis protein B n=1 Tax=Salinibacillus xinjiangensis TaxID=1229268 RepID=A0A6G1X3T6_9BACI|nr:molybdenum cofactor biosynthesis protein B [Salinibacillus xinjiangensis]MRG85651.1 molybdenum cofactor biosynthesis protein [Salinibacillus xinjiangensis]